MQRAHSIAPPRKQAAADTKARLAAASSLGLELNLFRSRHETRKTFPFSAKNLGWYLLGRSALSHGLDALGIEAGDGVLVPAYNHGVEVETMLERGLDVSWYGVRRDLTYDLDEIRSRVKPGTRAVYVIHYFGFPQSIAPLKALCDELGLLLIEDCALSLFAETDGVPVGSTGDMSLFSLHKTLGLAHGGVLALNRPDVTPCRGRTMPPALAMHGLSRRMSARLEVSAPAVTAAVRWLRRQGMASARRASNN